jgi:hypothetical protein
VEPKAPKEKQKMHIIMTFRRRRTRMVLAKTGRHCSLISKRKVENVYEFFMNAFDKNLHTNGAEM